MNTLGDGVIDGVCVCARARVFVCGSSRDCRALSQRSRLENELEAEV
eukprot:SAG31_NODE_37519_length_303_cov_1.210784_1_plen_46_part_10